MRESLTYISSHKSVAGSIQVNAEQQLNPLPFNKTVSRQADRMGDFQSTLLTERSQPSWAISAFRET